MTKPTEQELIDKGLTAPRVTPERIAHVIVREAFHVFPGTCLTVCVLTLRNGFTVTGESACASPANFDAEIGERYAREAARSKIWQLEGYALRERLTMNGAVPSFFDWLPNNADTLEAYSPATMRAHWAEFMEGYTPEIDAPVETPAATAKGRAEAELSQLTSRTEGLERFMNTDRYRALPFNQQSRLDMQHMHMRGYVEVLSARLAEWSEE
ncbi:MAG: Gp49 family protein [Steroidobacteraceae bacterium]